jgi:hypothetical protein
VPFCHPVCELPCLTRIVIFINVGNGKGRRCHIERLEEVLRDVRLVRLVEEKLGEVRECLVHEVVVLEGFTESRAVAEVSEFLDL